MTCGKEEMDEISCMVRVEMADKDVRDFVMTDPNTGELVQSSWPHVEKYEALIQMQCERGRTPVHQRLTRSRT
jgi:hypothetical protein